MCLKGRMNGLPQGSVVSLGQWVESMGRMGVLRLSGLNRPRKLRTACVLGLFTVSPLFSDLWVNSKSPWLPQFLGPALRIR